VDFRPEYPIRTTRLALRPFVASDVEAMLDLESREDVVQHLPWGVMDRAAAEAQVARRVTQTAITGDHTAIVLAATIPPDDRMIGEFMLQLSSERNRSGEIGWTLHPDVQGHGYALEASRELLRLGFEDLGLHRIMAAADPRNVASTRLMERLGMSREGVFRHVMFKGEWLDDVIYSILEGEWRALGRSERA
jgi:RimJ/RimL family protein N-acetyltransferase